MNKFIINTAVVLAATSFVSFEIPQIVMAEEQVKFEEISNLEELRKLILMGTVDNIYDFTNEDKYDEQLKGIVGETWKKYYGYYSDDMRRLEQEIKVLEEALSNVDIKDEIIYKNAGININQLKSKLTALKYKNPEKPRRSLDLFTQEDMDTDEFKNNCENFGGLGDRFKEINKMIALSDHLKTAEETLLDNTSTDTDTDNFEKAYEEAQVSRFDSELEEINNAGQYSNRIEALKAYCEATRTIIDCKSSQQVTKEKINKAKEAIDKIKNQVEQIKSSYKMVYSTDGDEHNLENKYLDELKNKYNDICNDLESQIEKLEGEEKPSEGGQTGGGTTGDKPSQVKPTGGSSGGGGRGGSSGGGSSDSKEKSSSSEDNNGSKLLDAMIVQKSLNNFTNE